MIEEVFGKVTELCGEIVSVALTEKITTFEVVNELPPEIVEDAISPVTPVTPAERHKQLLDSMRPMFEREMQRPSSTKMTSMAGSSFVPEDVIGGKVRL